MDQGKRWGVILAGGDGTRLRSLTRLISGDDRPKQFCPLMGGRTLLAQTRARTQGLIDPDLMLYALTCSHERFFARELAEVPANHMVVQPHNRGTLPALLWTLLHLLKLDERALVAFFPSDHYYSEEHRFVAGIEAAFNIAETGAHSLVLLGATASEPEVEYGWIEPGKTVGNYCGRPLMSVERFWEKPTYPLAQELFNRGCLWNMFVMVGRALAFVEMIRSAHPDLCQEFEGVFRLASGRAEVEAEMMATLYDRIDTVDFSRTVLAVSTSKLTVLDAGDIGWSDLGEPQRAINVISQNGIADALDIASLVPTGRWRPLPPEAGNVLER